MSNKIRGSAGRWYDEWLKTGRLPDGRRAYLVNLTLGGPYACFEPSAEQRQRDGLPIPWPGDPPTKDGYAPNWEHIEIRS